MDTLKFPAEERGTTYCQLSPVDTRSVARIRGSRLAQTRYQKVAQHL
ncbi:MAG: hypothetical protein QME78_13685 [Thermodesulfobacteriota bacterium]|nr:hypothetical protein [Thermodesulfobacteriota bacterium]